MPDVRMRRLKVSRRRWAGARRRWPPEATSAWAFGGLTLARPNPGVPGSFPTNLRPRLHREQSRNGIDTFASLWRAGAMSVTSERFQRIRDERFAELLTRFVGQLPP